MFNFLLEIFVVYLIVMVLGLDVVIWWGIVGFGLQLMLVGVCRDRLQQLLNKIFYMLIFIVIVWIFFKQYYKVIIFIFFVFVILLFVVLVVLGVVIILVILLLLFFCFFVFLVGFLWLLWFWFKVVSMVVVICFDFVFYK